MPITTQPKGVIKILAAGEKSLVVNVPTTKGPQIRTKATTRVQSKLGPVAICCDVLSCSVKHEVDEMMRAKPRRTIG